MSEKTINMFWAVFVVLLGVIMLVWGFWPTEQEWFEFYGRM